MVPVRSNNRKKSSRSRLLVISVAVTTVVLLLVGLELGHVTNFVHGPSAVSDTTGPTPEQKQQAAAVDADTKKDAIENPAEPKPSSLPTSDTVSLSTRKEANGTVTVFTNLGSITDGSCTLTVTNGSATTSQTATVIYQPEYSICAGFSIPVSSVGTGNWTLKLDVTSGGVTASKTLQVEVT